MNRSFVGPSLALLAALAVGCNDSDPTEPGPYLTVTPAFTGLAEGDSIQLTATFDGEPVEVTWEASEPDIATVSSTGWVKAISGGYAAATATMVSGPQQKRSASITVIPIPTLTSGTPVTGIASSGARGSGLFYKIQVPAGASQLRVTLAGGTGDVDLYIKHGSRPTNAVADCWSFNGGNGEECVVSNPAAGWWYVLLDLWTAYSGVTLTATVTP